MPAERQSGHCDRPEIGASSRPRHGLGNHMGRTVSGISSVLLAIAVMAASAPQGSAQQGEPVKIGVLIGLTGSSAVAGNDSYKCMQIAAEEVNAAGGVLGRPIKLVVQDDEGRPKAGVDGANLLADVEKVTVAVGAYSSGIGVPAGQVFNEKKVVWVTED